MQFRTLAIMVGATTVSSGFVGECRSDVLWNEAIHGDLSDDRFNPTHLNLALGVNSLTATSMQGDREYVWMTLPASMQLDQIILISYVGNDPISFIAVQEGTTFTEPPGNPIVANLLGYTHFGPDFVGMNILDQIGWGGGAIGFEGPLPSGEYTFWMQQTSSSPVTYQLDFIVTPSAPSLALLAFAAAAPRRRRRAVV